MQIQSARGLKLTAAMLSTKKAPNSCRASWSGAASGVSVGVAAAEGCWTIGARLEMGGRPCMQQQSPQLEAP